MMVRSARDGAVATITLDRPAKRNALSIAMRMELSRAFADAGADEGVAAVVLAAEPPAFCAGMDHTEFGGDERHKRALWDSTRAVFGALRAVPVPVIAAVGGPAIGGGFVLAASCDLIVAGPDARFAHVGARMGIPVSYGALLRVLPPQAARELAFTAREIDAEEARALGAARMVATDPLAAATDLARRIASFGRDVQVASKRLVLAAETGGDAERATTAELAAFHRGLFGTDPAPDGDEPVEA